MLDFAVTRFKFFCFSLLSSLFKTTIGFREYSLPTNVTEENCVGNGCCSYRSSLGIVLMLDGCTARISLPSIFLSDVSEVFSHLERIVRSFCVFFLNCSYEMSGPYYDDSEGNVKCDFLFENEFYALAVWKRLVSLSICIKHIPFINNVDFFVYDRGFSPLVQYFLPWPKHNLEFDAFSLFLIGSFKMWSLGYLPLIYGTSLIFLVFCLYLGNDGCSDTLFKILAFIVLFFSITSKYTYILILYWYFLRLTGYRTPTALYHFRDLLGYGCGAKLRKKISYLLKISDSWRIVNIESQSQGFLLKFSLFFYNLIVKIALIVAK